MMLQNTTSQSMDPSETSLEEEPESPVRRGSFAQGGRRRASRGRETSSSASERQRSPTTRSLERRVSESSNRSRTRQRRSSHNASITRNMLKPDPILERLLQPEPDHIMYRPSRTDNETFALIAKKRCNRSQDTDNTPSSTNEQAQPVSIVI